MITRYRSESRASNIVLAAVIALLALATFSTPGSEFASESSLAIPATYSWSEDSDRVRVGKDLLQSISIRSVTITNGNSVQFVLTPEFIHACVLTPEEIARVNAALAKALHEYRTVQGQHFEPMDDEATFERARNELPYATGTFKFSLKPFEAEAKGIRERLKSEVAASLGIQRANLFWQDGESYLDGEMNMGSHGRLVGQTHHFSVLTRVPGPLVDITVTYSGGSHGRPYGEALDPYAPEKLKPILKRWREWIAGQPQGSFVWTVPASEQTVIDIPPGLRVGRWDDASDHVDLPKPVAKALAVPGLTEDEELSPEAIATLGLTTNEVHAVNQLYQQMKLRTEALEQGNLVKPDPEKTSFILRVFPEQAAALQREWLTNLTVRIGAGRAELLDQYIRTPLWASMQRHHKTRGWDLNLWPGPRWFERGQFDLRINVEKVKWPNGLDGFRIHYESDSPESGDLPVLPQGIPARFRHLLTPEMLEKPGLLQRFPNAEPAARFEPGIKIKTLRDELDRLESSLVTQFDDDAPGLRAAYLSGFESGYTAAFLGDLRASRARWAPTHDRPSFARQVGFLAGEQAAFEALLEGSAREQELTSVDPSADGNDASRGSRSK